MTQTEFETIATTLREHAFNCARRTLTNTDDADDVAGDTMLKLWALHDELATSDNAIRLACVISRNAAIDSLRKRQRTSALMVSMDEDETVSWSPPDFTAPSPDEQLEWKESETWLRQRIDSLPAREMQVLKMRQVEKRSNSEIASLLGINEKSVGTLLSSARRKLFNQIKERNKQ